MTLAQLSAAEPRQFYRVRPCVLPLVLPFPPPSFFLFAATCCSRRAIIQSYVPCCRQKRCTWKSVRAVYSMVKGKAVQIWTICTARKASPEMVYLKEGAAGDPKGGGGGEKTR